MPNIQTSFIDPPKGIEGMPDFAFDRDTMSYHVTGASAIPFGRFVKRGADDRGIVVGIEGTGGNTVTHYRGFTTCDTSREGAEYKTGDVANVQTSGVVWAVPTTAVTSGSRVTVTAATGRPRQGGNTGTTIIVIQARWIDDAAANGLARLRLDQAQEGA